MALSSTSLEDDFFQAIVHGDFPRFQQLLDRNQSLAMHCERAFLPGFNMYPLHWLVAGTADDTEQRLDFARVLLQHGTDPNVCDESERTPLFLACCLGREEAVLILLRYGADPHREDIDADSPFHVACRSGSLPVIQTLLDHGVSPNVRNRKKETPLFAAVGHEAAMQLLFQQGKPDVHLVNIAGQTALMTCLFWRETKCARILLDHGTNVNAQDHQASTALSIAIEKELVDMVEMLLEQGASFSVVNKMVSPFWQAVEKREKHPGILYSMLRRDPQLWIQA